MREGDGGLRALERSAQPLALVRPQLLLPELHGDPRVVRRRQSGAYAVDAIGLGETEVTVARGWGVGLGVQVPGATPARSVVPARFLRLRKSLCSA